MKGFSGRVKSGLGKGSYFTRLDWVRRAFRRRLGVDPYPGTLNLAVERHGAGEPWFSIRREKGIPIDPPPGDGSCPARGYPVRLNASLPGAIVVPQLEDYPEDQVEIISALPLRKTLGLRDGDTVRVRLNEPLAVGALVFDVDGTLIDTLEVYRICAQKVADPLGVTITRAMIRHTLNTHESLWKPLLPPGQRGREDVIRRLDGEARLYFPEALRSHGRVFPNLRQTLEQLTGLGLRLGIFTGTRSEFLQPLRELGLLSWFDAMVTWDEVSRLKPDPRGLEICLDRLGAEAGRAAYVGDTPLDVRASRAAGMRSISVLTGSADCAMLAAECPDWIIDSHEQLRSIVEPPGGQGG